MIHNAAFRRKVVYLALIALLLIPLYVVGRPAVGDPLDVNSSPGGRLAQLRAEHDLSPAQIGEVDPTSESMKLATLGLRGVAATILWNKAHEYKKKENWEGLIAVVNQMAKLQPNFISVWEFQSHNLSYNVSAEQDDYRFRYLWVKRGIEFLIQGTHFNRREPKLFWTVGWYMGQKFNRSDEHKQFRRLFKEDQDFHDSQSRYIDIDGQGRGADSKPDSWLASRLWYLRSYDIVDTQGRPIRGKAAHIFYADGPKALMNYAGAIEEDGFLDERAEYAWKRASDEWTEYGDKQVITSVGLPIRLNDEESRRAEGEQIAKALDELVPEGRAAARQAKVDRLSAEERKALETPLAEISDPNVMRLHYEALYKVEVTHNDVAAQAPPNVRARAYRLARQADEAANFVDWIDRYRSNVNFEYWRTRCLVEQKREIVAARRHIYDANKLVVAGEVDAARKEYEKAWDLWAQVMEENPILIDSLTEDDLVDYLQKYVKLLATLDVKLPEDFKLRRLLERSGRLTGDVTGAPTTDAAAPAGASDANAAAPSTAAKPDEKPAPTGDGGKQEVKPAPTSDSEKPEGSPAAKPAQGNEAAKPHEKPAPAAEGAKPEEKTAPAVDAAKPDA
jgi:hypothetical protein